MRALRCRCLVLSIKDVVSSTLVTIRSIVISCRISSIDVVILELSVFVSSSRR